VGNWVYGSPIGKISLDGGYTCPNRDGTKGFGGCLYCGYGSRGLIPEEVSIEKQIEESLRYRKEKILFAYFQAYTSTYGRFSTLKEQWEVALSHRRITGLVVSTRPDCLPEEVLEEFLRIHAKKPFWVEIGVETLSDATLKKMNRGHGSKETLNALKTLGKLRIPVVVHLIFGLPGEGKEEILHTVTSLTPFPIWGYKIHPFHIVEGSLLLEGYKKGKIRLWEEEEFIEICTEALRRIPPDRVIHRLTGSGPGPRHVAPFWTTRTRYLTEKIRQSMMAKGAQQGDLLPPLPP
jgi:hypothetical protein